MPSPRDNEIPQGTAVVTSELPRRIGSDKTSAMIAPRVGASNQYLQ